MKERNIPGSLLLIVGEDRENERTIFLLPFDRNCLSPLWMSARKTNADQTNAVPASGEEATSSAGRKPLKINRLSGILCLLFGHAWQHCACRRCGHPRDTDHDWQLVPGESCKLKCSVCGMPHANHQFNEIGLCRVCGAPKSTALGGEPYDTHTTFWTLHG